MGEKRVTSVPQSEQAPPPKETKRDVAEELIAEAMKTNGLSRKEAEEIVQAFV